MDGDKVRRHVSPSVCGCYHSVAVFMFCMVVLFLCVCMFVRRERVLSDVRM